MNRMMLVDGVVVLALRCTKAVFRYASFLSSAVSSAWHLLPLCYVLPVSFSDFPDRLVYKESAVLPAVFPSCLAKRLTSICGPFSPMQPRVPLVPASNGAALVDLCQGLSASIYIALPAL